MDPRVVSLVRVMSHEHSAVHVTVSITLTSYVHAIMIFIDESVFSIAFIGATVNIQNHCSRL